MTPPAAMTHPLAPARRPPASRGFSLVEMAVVLAILGLLLGGGLMVLSAQAEQQRVKDTEALLQTGLEAVSGFAAIQPSPRLPCPDRTAGAGANDGVEDLAGTTCAVLEGNLPWVTLGLGDGLDRWGNRFRYRIATKFNTNFTLATAADLTVNNAAGAAIATQVPALIVSHGKNGSGAVNSSGGGNPAPTGASEIQNTNGDTTFISNAPVGAGGTGGEFDDQLVWLSRNVLFNRMIQAGRLP